jgi:hypothetical protein
MRLFVAAVTVVATFVVVVLLISRLFPHGAGWAGTCVAITCLYASAFGAWALLGNNTGKKGRATQAEGVQQHFLRDNLLYFAVAMAVVTITVAVTIRDTERGIHRSFKNDWFVGLGSACVALGYAAKAFWIFRRNWHLWAVISALLALFTAIAIPVSPKWRRCHCCLWGRWPMSNCSLLLWYLTGSLVGIRGDVAHRSC